MCNHSLRLFLGFLCSLLVACEQPADTETKERRSLSLAPTDWNKADIPDGGDLEIDGDVLVLLAGAPLSGAVFSGDPAVLPVVDYRIRYQAYREDGLDFFSSMTFPVRSLDTPVTLILGGWGGGLVGISSIDQLDASENSTGASQRFENGQWYAIEITVEADLIRVWIDDRPVVNVAIAGRRVGLRSGDIEGCAPLGFASWRTRCRVRSVEIEALGDTLRADGR